MPNTPDNVLAVGCPVCKSRPGLQCSISFIPALPPEAAGVDGQAVDTVPPFELKLWAHEERVRLGRKPTVAAPCVFQ